MSESKGKGRAYLGPRSNSSPTSRLGQRVRLVRGTLSRPGSGFIARDRVAVYLGTRRRSKGLAVIEVALTGDTQDPPARSARPTCGCRAACSSRSRRSQYFPTLDVASRPLAEYPVSESACSLAIRRASRGILAKPAATSRPPLWSRPSCPRRSFQQSGEMQSSLFGRDRIKASATRRFDHAGQSSCSGR